MGDTRNFHRFRILNGHPVRRLEAVRYEAYQDKVAQMPAEPPLDPVPVPTPVPEGLHYREAVQPARNDVQSLKVTLVLDDGWHVTDWVLASIHSPPKSLVDVEVLVKEVVPGSPAAQARLFFADTTYEDVVPDRPFDAPAPPRRTRR